MKLQLTAALMLLPSFAQAASVSLVPLSEALTQAPNARALLAGESSQVGGPDFSAGATTVLSDAVAAFGKGSFFYALFDTFKDTESSRLYAIQRVRKTTRGYRSASDTRPLTSVEYLVEIFKLRDGEFKRADMHHGTYPMGGFYKREVLKELEIGIGEIPGTATGDAWPFDPATLYKLVQDYSVKREIYDSVHFDRSTSWMIDATFGSDGRHELQVPALQVDLGSGF
jgi:hypothetical protein